MMGLFFLALSHLASMIAGLALATRLGIGGGDIQTARYFAQMKRKILQLGYNTCGPDHNGNLVFVKLLKLPCMCENCQKKGRS